MIRLNTRKKVAFNTARRRNQNVSEEGTLKHLAGEIVELSVADAVGTVSDVESELADVVICCLTYAHIRHIDIEKAVREKMAYNKKRV